MSGAASSSAAPPRASDPSTRAPLSIPSSSSRAVSEGPSTQTSASGFLNAHRPYFSQTSAMRTLNHVSKRFIAFCILDWIVIIAIAGVGAAFNAISPYHRAFSLLDLSISFPMKNPETISTWLLIVISLVIPAGIILVVCAFFIPGQNRIGRNNHQSDSDSTSQPHSRRYHIWLRKLAHLNTSWQGLALALATTFFVTQGMKNLFGVPRPDLLSRCIPDANKIADFQVGGYGESLSRKWVLVTSGICTQTDKDVLNDGFKSFPSGHSSFSWAGLSYLTFFLCAHFAISIPFLPPIPPPHDAASTPSTPILPLHNPAAPTTPSPTKHHDTTSAPSTPTTPLPAEPTNGTTPSSQPHAEAPIPLLAHTLTFLPLGAAIYVAASRYFDYRHHGFDIIVGSVIGIVCAWGSFRWFVLGVKRPGARKSA